MSVTVKKYNHSSSSLTFSESDSTLHLHFVGELNEQNAEMLKEAFAKIIKAEQKEVVFDMRSVPAITFSGIGKFLLLSKYLNRQNRKLTIENTHEDLYRFFASIHLDKMITINKQ